MTAKYSRNLILHLWWLIALCAVLAGVGACIASAIFFRVYQASSLLQVEIRFTEPGINTTLLADRLLTTEDQLATSDSTLAQVVADFPQLSVSSLKGKVSATTLPNTFLLQITVQDSDASRAAAIANDIASILTAEQTVTTERLNTAMERSVRQEIATTEQQIAQLTQQLKALGNPPSDLQKAEDLQVQLAPLQALLSQDELQLTYIQEIEVINSLPLAVAQHAQPPQLPGVSRILEGTAAGLFSGALLGFLLAASFDFLNWRVRSAEDVQRLLDTTVLGKINRPAKDSENMTEAVHADLSDICRSLVQSFNFLGIAKPLRTIAIVSPEQTDISKILASGLALYLASSGRRTLLIDGYLDGGRQGRQFGIPVSPGLSDAALEVRKNSSGAIAPLGYARSPINVHAPLLLVLPAGTPPPNPNQMLMSQAMEQVLATLFKSQAEIIILDTPPVLGRLTGSTSAKALLKQVDGILLVVDLLSTRKDRLLRAQQTLAEMDVRVLGCVVAGSATQPSPSQAAATETLLPANVMQTARPTAPINPTKGPGSLAMPMVSHAPTPTRDDVQRVSQQPVLPPGTSRPDQTRKRSGGLESQDAAQQQKNQGRYNKPELYER